MNKSMFDYSIKCGESLIFAQQNVKWLGLKIDDKLNLKKHIKIVQQKAACAKERKVGIFLQNHSIICLKIYYCNFTMPWLNAT